MMEINGPVVGGARGGGFYGNLPPTVEKGEEEGGGGEFKKTAFVPSSSKVELSF